jgi:hypothetical protein
MTAAPYGKRRLSMIALSSTGKPNYSSWSWDCPRCTSGQMVWFACDLRQHGTLVEHRFACDKCSCIELVSVPFAAPNGAA